MRRFWLERLGQEGDVVLLGERESHHLLRVTGIAPGEQVTLFDGQGGLVAAELLGVRDGCAELRQLRPLEPAHEIPTWLLIAQLKRPAFELALRMGTELGVTTFVPVQADRSVAKGDKRDRWERIIRSAAAQSGREAIPEVLDPLRLGEALAVLPEGVGAWMGLPGAPSHPRPTGPVAVLVGPEGGWSEGEVELAGEGGVTPLGLGPTTLRADTAAAAALTWATSAR